MSTIIDTTFLVGIILSTPTLHPWMMEIAKHIIIIIIIIVVKTRGRPQDPWQGKKRSTTTFEPPQFTVI